MNKKYICEDCYHISERDSEYRSKICGNEKCYGIVFSAEKLIYNIGNSAEEMPFESHGRMIDIADFIKERCMLLNMLIKGENNEKIYL